MLVGMGLSKLLRCHMDYMDGVLVELILDDVMFV